ncbi:MAG: alpha/beta fold hydrolase [Minisyncoccia bacterium]
MSQEFIRFITEDMLILQGLISRPIESGKKAYLHIHGMGGNFYENRFIDVMAENITQAGYAFLSTNTRGHDIIADFPIAGSEEKYKRIGDAYEKFEECILDIKSAIDYLQKNGYEEVVLCGHSLGAVKVVYYVAKTQDVRVKKLVLMSPPDMIGLAEEGSNHKDLLSQSQKMISEGRGDELLPVKIWDWYHLSASTYVDLNTRDNPVDIFNTYDKTKPSILSEIKIPTFAFLGEKDDAAILPQQEALEVIKSKAVNAPSFEVAIIEGAPHSYFGKEQVMAERITKWLI